MHKKNYIDSLKRQVQAVGKDKAKYEQSYNETKAELQKRVGLYHSQVFHVA